MIEEIKQIMTAAGEKMLRFKDPEIYIKEGHANFVTQADIEVQEFLIGRLKRLCPQAAFYAEEKDDNVLTDAPTFIIDPIDGTTNFMRGRDWSSISVALAENGETVAGAVYNPYQKEMFWAEKGKGAYLNDRPIHVSAVPFERALVSMGTSPYQAELARRSMSACAEFLLKAGDLRRLGSAALDLCDVARGNSEVFFELVLSPWDYAAGMLIVTEAGGRVGSPENGKLGLARKMGVLAANPLCYDQAAEILKSV